MSLMLSEPLIDRKTSAPKVRKISPHKRSLNTSEAVAIRHLSRFSMLTALQLAYVTGRAYKTSSDALTGLYRKGLACYGGVHSEGINVDTPRKPKRVFSLNKEGVAYLEHHQCSAFLANRKPVARSWSRALIADDEIHHKLGIIDCMLSLWRSTATFSDFEIIYMSPDFVNAENSESINKDTYGKGDLIPDVVAIILNKKVSKTRTFFIEFDRGHAPLWLAPETKKKARKGPKSKGVPLCDRFANYDAYFANKDRKNGKDDPKLLWITEKESWLDTVRNSEHMKWSGWDELKGRVHFSCLARIKESFLESLWTPPETDVSEPLATRKLS